MRSTRIPDSRAAAIDPPTAYMSRPKCVRFWTNSATRKTTIMIQIGVGMPSVRSTPTQAMAASATVSVCELDHRFTTPVRAVMVASVTTKNDMPSRPISAPLMSAPIATPITTQRMIVTHDGTGV